ncbi:MAG TPA: aminotransferase class I/II-fold pyridoxal phosphate-dependent enzyme [Vicinamibacteria bacterium]|nr:aminotransferase class I/II-fold pyridoxal phosphate-dependent enzyme [Vicinamibacteria bacterium]
MKRGIGTRAVHGKGQPRPGPLTTPVAQTSTFVFASSAEMRRYLEGGDDLYLYTRYANPTVRELEESLAALEEAEAALALASGMAAASTGLLSLVKAGDEVLASSSLYGGTTRLLRDLLPNLGIATRLVTPGELERLSPLVGKRTRALIVESPTNPTLDVVDLTAVAEQTHQHGLVLMVDNTFATPVLQRPLALGADLVMHSLTKALSGHSDLIGGALVGSRERIEKARGVMKLLGGCLDPHPAFLVLRGLKTVHLRVERQCANAMALAQHLLAHPKVSGVRYPGLPTHPGHAIARRQMSAFGGMVAFSLDGGLPAAERFYDGLRLVARAASLGGVETLVSLPVHTSHYGYTPDQLAAAGVDPGMVRVSLGVEDPADLLADIDSALTGV